MSNPVRTIAVPRSYRTPADSQVLISNYPDTAPGVTPIQVVTLNRPDRLNAFTIDMINALEEFFSIADVDDRIKVIVLTGAGRAFSAGIDLSVDATAGRSLPTRDLRDPGGTLALSMYNCSKTIIVAYNGLSVGIGMTSTLAAAIR
jgi:enoyl-CoA hydratase/carnithine racemase